MIIRKAHPTELDRIMDIMESAKVFMAAHGNPNQWVDGYPQRELVAEDLELGRGYVCVEDGHIYAYFMLLSGEEPTYQVIDGAWLNDLPYLTLHRIASSGEKRGMMDEIARWAVRRNPNLRADTYTDNLPMQKAFERNGFVYCGTIWLEDGRPRMAYHRVPKPKLIVVAGTNASGKSDLGVELALQFNGEIVSADSRQIYRGLDLGSGKIRSEEMRGVPHHLLDIRDAGDFFSMADFQREAYAAIDDIIARGKTPFLVGGTGLYIASVADGYQMSGKMPDLEYRAQLERLTTETLYKMLMEKLPGYQVEAKNRNRVMRVLEKLHDGDDIAPGKQPRYDTLKLGITWPREELCRRIEQRMTRRFAHGMMAEVQGLLDQGISAEFLLKLGLEYRLITQYLTGVIGSEEELNQLLNIAIRQFAKRQMTWFKRDQDIHWLNMETDPRREACYLIEDFLG
ncbi:MAG: tRNA (adenosine(37)-N6)-dimethylallyltransferase MiaA [Eubacteriales bacterium]|nr:tRNA (adenosine(37)-N6)-dimethylallyltransferase MiaA [Eubacteriales bacterium]